LAFTEGVGRLLCSTIRVPWLTLPVTRPGRRGADEAHSAVRRDVAEIDPQGQADATWINHGASQGHGPNENRHCVVASASYLPPLPNRSDRNFFWEPEFTLGLEIRPTCTFQWILKGSKDRARVDRIGVDLHGTPLVSKDLDTNVWYAPPELGWTWNYQPPFM